MKKHFRDTDLCKWLIVIIELAMIVAAVWFCIYLYTTAGFAEGAEWQEAFIICKPGDYVNIRPHPNKKCEELGRLDAGDRIMLDGKKKNGYLHCVDLTMEQSEGWVFAGYVVNTRPERMDREATVVSIGRLAARRYVDGKRTKWLKPGTVVTVWFRSDEWCVTNYGYIMTEYLELEGQ